MVRRLTLFLTVAAIWLSGQTPPRAALAVVEKFSGNIGFYDAAGSLIAEVKVGMHPHEMVLSPDGRLLYVTNNGMIFMTDPGDGENSVSIVDVVQRRSLGTIDLGPWRRPHGVDIDPATGNLLVTTEKPSALLVIDPHSRKIVRQYDVKGEAPHMVLLAPGGRWAFVSNTNTGGLGAVDLETGGVTIIPTGPRPQGMALSLDRKTIYVANSAGESITIVDAVARRRVGDIPTGKSPVRVVATPDGNTLVYAIQGANAVGFADVRQRKEIGQVPLPGQPSSLTLSADRKQAYCGVQSADRIFVLSIADRKIVRVIATPPGSGPDPVFALPR